MPVLIYAPLTEMDIVRPLAEELISAGGEVRCYLEDDDFELRQIGCKIAIGELTDDMNLEAALTNVHTFLPLFPDPAAIVTDADLENLCTIGDSAVQAAAASSHAQTILAIPALVRTDSELGRAYRQIADGFADIHPKALFEIGLLWGPNRPFTQVAGSFKDELMLSVLNMEGLVAALTRADDHEDLDGTWELGGEAVTVSELRQRDAGGESAPDLLQDALRSDLVIGMAVLEAIAPVRSNR